MAQFQNTVLKVSVVIFIILMVLIALMMFFKQNKIKYGHQSNLVVQIFGIGTRVEKNV